MDQEIRLYRNFKEREEYDNQANLYSILNSLELLERAHIRDSIDQDEYFTTCTKLLGQFKTTSELLKNTVPDIEEFAKRYKLNCSAALSRIAAGVPNDYEKLSSKTSVPTLNPKFVAQVVQSYITLMDSIKLNMVAVDELHPLLSDLIQYIDKLPQLPKEFTGRSVITDWLIVLNRMKASECLDDDQIRELSFDLEKTYNQFHRILEENQ
ncbi:hypothetical protein BB560_006348 [Smittium megazygosporum]|uniref:Vacuolar protein sorting-associated protein 28 n=1 Tax=Smittium megazygosporum TaxID=133381 RepID=A0A2T9Y8N2_9FUNG|nr:hypothetical protein BB560_006348 [Smittium megazygosporum]